MTVDVPVRSPRRWLARRGPVAMAVVLVLAIGWWSTSARAFTGGSGYAADVPIGEHLHVGSVGVLRADVSLLRVHANATDGVEVRVVRCLPRDGELLGTARDLEPWCARVDEVGFRTRVPGASRPPDVTQPYLVVSVTPTAPGPQWVCGLDVVYRAGWRFGWQRHVVGTIAVNVGAGATSPCDGSTWP